MMNWKKKQSLWLMVTGTMMVIAGINHSPSSLGKYWGVRTISSIDMANAEEIAGYEHISSSIRRRISGLAEDIESLTDRVDRAVEKASDDEADTEELQSARQRYAQVDQRVDALRSRLRRLENGVERINPNREDDEEAEELAREQRRQTLNFIDTMEDQLDEYKRSLRTAKEELIERLREIREERLDQAMNDCVDCAYYAHQRQSAAIDPMFLSRLEGLLAARDYMPRPYMQERTPSPYFLMERGGHPYMQNLNSRGFFPPRSDYSLLEDFQLPRALEQASDLFSPVVSPTAFPGLSAPANIRDTGYRLAPQFQGVSFGQQITRDPASIPSLY